MQGLPQSAIDLIAQLQPYSDPQNHILNLLNQLCNKDKHRDLNYSISVASDVALSFIKDGINVYSLILGNDEIKNNGIFGNLGFDPSLFTEINVDIKGKAQAYLAFSDQKHEFNETMPVVDTLDEITNFVKYQVIDSLVDYLQ